MNKSKLTTILTYAGLVAGGFILGRKTEKRATEKRTVYAGELQITRMDDTVDMYVSLSVLPEDLAESANAVFKINKI